MVLGTFQIQYSLSSSSEYTIGYDLLFYFAIIGLGEEYDEIILERKDWSTEVYEKSGAQMVDNFISNFYIGFFGIYTQSRCAKTGQHRFKIRTNGVTISYFVFPIFRLNSK